MDRSIDGMRDAMIALLDFVDSPNGGEFDAVTQMAARQFGCDFAHVSLVDSREQHFVSTVGIACGRGPRSAGVCAEVIDRDETLIIEDLSKDPRFWDSPYVVGAPHARFYAGIPLHAQNEIDGTSMAVGTLCIMDRKARPFDKAALAVLEDMARLAEALIQARWAARQIGRLMADGQNAIAELRREQRLFKQAERLANLGSWRLTLAEGHLNLSDQIHAIYEMEPGDGLSLEAAVSRYAPQDQILIRSCLERAVKTGEPFEFEVDFVTAKGNKRRLRCAGELEEMDGEPVALVGVLQDVSHQHELQETLRRHASTDDLTRLPNRAECNRVLDATMARARQAGTPCALLLIDLDGFKAVNDRCGHLAGDDLLRRIGQRLSLPYLADAFAARLGGDEFVVLLSTPEDCARLDTILARLLADLRDTIPNADGPLSVSGTIGVAWLDESMASRSDFLHGADVALYAAKKSQRGTAQIFGAPPESSQLSLSLPS